MSRLNADREDAVELTGPERWAWGRNGEIRRPTFVTVKDMSLPSREEIWISVYANARTMENGTSPIDLHISKDDARRLAEKLLLESSRP